MQNRGYIIAAQYLPQFCSKSVNNLGETSLLA